MPSPTACRSGGPPSLACVIRATHSLIYSDDPSATRAFFRDVLELPFVRAEDSGGPGWLIFGSGPSEFGVHPAQGPQGERWDTAGRHQICFVVEDVDAAVRDLSARGAVFDGPPRKESFGRVVMLRVPGTDDLLLYEADHPTAFDL